MIMSNEEHDLNLEIKNGLLFEKTKVRIVDTARRTFGFLEFDDRERTTDIPTEAQIRTFIRVFNVWAKEDAHLWSFRNRHTYLMGIREEAARLADTILIDSNIF